MNVVFMGTPEFAVPSLEALVSSGHRVRAVFTQPDKPAGRGGKLHASPVKRAAERLNLPIHQPAKIRTPEVFDLLRSLGADAIVIVGYGKIIPQNIIDLPPLGCINLHASLLPKYRGAAPINWAIVNGETVTGVTTMKIDAGLDTGDMLLKAEVRIGPDDDAVSLGARLAQIGAPLLVETLQRLAEGVLQPVPQDGSQATLAPIMNKEDGRIDWTRSAKEIENRVRGLAPWPGAYTGFRGSLLHVWKAKAGTPATGAVTEPGTVIAATKDSLAVACGGASALELLEVQLEGKKRLPARDFMNGARVAAG